MLSTPFLIAYSEAQVWLGILGLPVTSALPASLYLGSIPRPKSMFPSSLYCQLLAPEAFSTG